MSQAIPSLSNDPFEMPQAESRSERWRLEVSAQKADRVYVVRELVGGPGQWVEMSRLGSDPTQWTVELDLLPGDYRLRYYTVEGRTFINCGSIGLQATRLGDPVAGVRLADQTMALSA